MKIYADDSAASAVVLNEFGEAYINITGDEGTQLSYEYHTKLKILTTEGLSKGDFTIPIYRTSSQWEVLASMKASTFVLSGTSYREIPLNTKLLMTDKLNENWDLLKFTLPGVTVGSVIEVQYKIESPFIYNFRTWKFQDDIPKIYSEFWALIPGNYIYNTTLKGYLKLSKNESTIVKRCVELGRGQADCALNKYAMKRIPAFRDEAFVSSPKNFMASINYELSEIHHFGGRVDRITKDWKDVEEELRYDERFGGQLRKGRNLFDNRLAGFAALSASEEAKARLTYDYIKSKILWNGRFGFLPQEGTRKAFESGKGNIGDINLNLIAALTEVGLDASPVLLSTRENGTPIMIHPVISDFNYVVAHLKIGDKLFLLDATDPLLPFGMLPFRCLNGKGRLITRNEGSWIDLQTRSRDRQMISMELVLGTNGLTGILAITHSDYAAYKQRLELRKYSSEGDYLKGLEAKWRGIKITRFETHGKDSLDSDIFEEFTIEIADIRPDQSILYIDPFFVGKVERNPLRSETRHFPVDLGLPTDRTFILNLDYPEALEVDEVPSKKALALPRNGGRFLFTASDLGGTISLTSILSMAKAVYPAEEYAYLRELFTNVVQVNQSVLVLKKKD
jgi:hypothetical protein